MTIVIRCECGQEFETPDENAGRRGRCPACQRPLIVPARKPLAERDFAPLFEIGPTQTSGKAIASLILGLCSFVLCLLTGIPAIILGILGLVDITNPKKHLSGKGIAISGIILGSLGGFVIVPIALLLPAVQAAREAARRAQCTNNLKQIALAMFNYESAYGSFPPAAIYDENGKPLLSWRVLILPYLEEGPLYSRFRLDEPWDSPNNKPLGDQMLKVFKCPSDPDPGVLTNYQIIVDPRSIFTGKPSGVSVRQIIDGTANTFLVIEAARPVPWSKPEDLTLGSLDDSAQGAGSKHPGGFDASMADGSVRFIKRYPSNPVNPQLLRALATKDGGEVVSVP